MDNENDPEILGLDSRLGRRCCIRMTEREYLLLKRRAWELKTSLAAMLRESLRQSARRAGLDL